MDILINIVLIIGPIILSIVISLRRNFSIKHKSLILIICFIICSCGVYRAINDWKKNEENIFESKTIDYYRQVEERIELLGRGFPASYINGLGENPLLKAAFVLGEKYQKENKLDEAINQFKICLNYPKAKYENKISAYIYIGNCYYLSSQYKSAEKYYHDALIFINNIKMDSEILRAKSIVLCNLGKISFVYGNQLNASAYLEESIKIAEKTNNKYAKAYSINTIGLIQRASNENDKSIEKFKMSLALFEEIQDKKGIAANLADIGSALFNLDKFKESMEYFEKSLAINISINNQEGIANDKGRIGRSLQDLGRTKEAISYMNEAISICRKSNIKQVLSNNLIFLGCTYFFDDRAESKKCFIEALGINKEIGYSNGIALCHLNLGILLYWDGNMNESEDNYINALIFYNDINNIYYMADCYYGLSLIYDEKGDYQFANKLKSGRSFRDEIRHFLKTTSYDDKLNNDPHELSEYVRIGHLYRNIGESEKALELMLKGLEIAKIDSNESLAYCHSNIGSCYADLQLFDKSVYQYQQAINIYKNAKTKTEEVAQTYYNMGIVYEIRGKIDDALRYYDLAIESSDSQTFKNNIARMLLSRANNNRANNHMEEASKYEKFIKKNL